MLAGKDAGKRGKVEEVIRRDASPSPVRSGYRRVSLKGGVYVVVEGLNIARKHTKPRQRSQGGPGSMPTVDPGGILDHAMPMPIARVMVVCGHCDHHAGRPPAWTTAPGCASASTAAIPWR